MNQTNNAHTDEVGTRGEQELTLKGTVLSLHIAPAAHVPMTSLSSAQLVPGRGIVGDRFYLRRGRDATNDRFTCDVTLVEEETIETMKRQGPSVGLGESARRNIVVRGCILSQLVGRTFLIGNVTLHGLAPRNGNVPSESVQQVAHLESTEQATRCLVLPRSDLRAEILTEGTIYVGDRLEIV
jgi:MOSC domain-containing protein YiiM